MTLPSPSSLLIAMLIAGIFTALHVVADWMIRRAAVRRLYAIQDEMDQVCQRRSNPDANRQMDVLAHEAGHLLARFGIDYWAVVRRGKDHRP
jgi:hypothetical protein